MIFVSGSSLNGFDQAREGLLRLGVFDEEREEDEKGRMRGVCDVDGIGGGGRSG
jgi:hypothetical protein